MKLTNSIDDLFSNEIKVLKTPDIQNLRNLTGISNSDIGEKDSEKKSAYTKSSDASCNNMLSDLGIDKISTNQQLLDVKLDIHENSLNLLNKDQKKKKKNRRRHKDTVGPWKLGKTLGKGSSGRVRLAKNQKTGKLAAIKIVPKGKPIFKKKDDTNDTLSSANGDNDNDSVIFEESSVPYGIEREIIIMKLVTHTNIMGLYEVWENKNELYLVLEYVDGGELFDHLVASGKFSESEAVYYFRQIIQGVSYLHKFNICHRDLKPENLLLDKSNQKIKIADFGMAALELSDKLLETSCGSPHYASPEIVKGSKYNGSPSDVWSCGIILFALLAGYLPFNDSDIKTLLMKVQLGKYDYPKHFTTEAKDLIDRMLKLDPHDRILIDEVLNHPLLLKYSRTTKNKSNSNINNLLKNQDVIHIKENNLFPTLPISSDNIFFNSKDDIDKTILESLQILWHGISTDLLYERLLNKDQNEEKIFYSLLYKYQSKQHDIDSSDALIIKDKKMQEEINLLQKETSDIDTPQTPKLGAISRFSSFLSLTRLQFGTSHNLIKENGFQTEKQSSQQFDYADSKPGLGLFVNREAVVGEKETKKKSENTFYPLSSISKRSLNLSNYLLHDFVKDDYSPLAPVHKNEFSIICENLLFGESEKPAFAEDTQVANIKKHNTFNTKKNENNYNTFKKMSLDPRLKKATLQTLSTFLNQEKKDSNTTNEKFVSKQNEIKKIKSINFLNEKKPESNQQSEIFVGQNEQVEESFESHKSLSNVAYEINKLSLPKNELRTTTTFNDLNLLLNSNTNGDSFDYESEAIHNIKESDITDKTKTKISNPNLPTTKSYLFADLESGFSIKNLSASKNIGSCSDSQNNDFVIAKRKVIPLSESNEENSNYLTNQNQHLDTNDYRGSLYVSNKPDFDEITMNDINTSVNKLKNGEIISLGSQRSDLMPLNISNLKLSPEKVKPKNKKLLNNVDVQRNSHAAQFLDNHDKFRDSKYLNRDSRLLEITIGDMTTDYINGAVKDNKNEVVDDEQRRVTMLFDEDDKIFFEEHLDRRNKKSSNLKRISTEHKSSTNLKKNSQIESGKFSNGYNLKQQSKSESKKKSNIISNANKGSLNVKKIRQTGIKSKLEEVKNTSQTKHNWFIRLVSRINSSSHSSSEKDTSGSKHVEWENNSIKENSFEESEELTKPPTVLHERVFNNKNVCDLNDFNILMTKQLKFLKSKFSFFDYSMSCENPSIVTYHFYDNNKNLTKQSIITLTAEAIAVDGTLTAMLSQLRNINDKNSDKIRLFNELSTYILKII
ncbi:hypothetical protein QEN19_002790 [Hanseniaspora menglaensis]